RPRRVDVEARARADVDLRVLARDVDSTWARVWDDQRDAELGGVALRSRLHAEVLLGAGEAREPVHRRNRAALGGRPQVRREPHRARAGRGAWLVSDLPAAEAPGLVDDFQRLHLRAHLCRWPGPFARVGAVNLAPPPRRAVQTALTRCS